MSELCLPPSARSYPSHYRARVRNPGIGKGRGAIHQMGAKHHRAKHRPEVIEMARWMADTFAWGDITIGYLLNVPSNTVRDWRAYRTRISG